MSTFRPAWLPRRADFTPTRLEMDSEVAPDASRTFGPAKSSANERLAVFAVLAVTAVAMVCAVVHVVARVTGHA
jgi:hypothetical protein